jgi:hypothetical protein
MSLLPEQWKCCPKLTYLFNLTSWSVHILPSRSVLEDWRTGKKRTVGYPLSFLLTIFSISGSLMKGCDKTRKEYDGVHWLFVFLRIPLPSFCVSSKFWFKWKWHSLSGLSATPIYLAWRSDTPCTHLGSCWTLRHAESTEMLGRGLSKTLYGSGWVARNGLSPLLTRAPLFH